MKNWGRVDSYNEKSQYSEDKLYLVSNIEFDRRHRIFISMLLNLTQEIDFLLAGHEMNSVFGENHD